MSYWGKKPKHTCDFDDPKRHGCGGKHSDNPWWGLKCWTCFGHGHTNGERCDVCNGSGLIGMTQCPNSANTGTMDLIFESWRWLETRNVFPQVGALYDQNHLFVTACDFIDAMSSTYELDARQTAMDKGKDNGKK